MARFPFCATGAVLASALCLTSFVTAAEKKNHDPNTKHFHGVISKVDASHNSVTIKSTDNKGKGEEKTFEIPSTAKMKDDTGHMAKLDAFKSGDHVCITEKNDKVTAIHKHAEATITKVDAKAGTVMVKMKDKNGKDVEKTFGLIEESEYLDSDGRVAELDVFRNGDDVLVIEADGKIQEMKKSDKSKTSTSSSK